MGKGKKCASLAGCPFFNDKMKGQPKQIDLYKGFYCLDNFERCARFMVASKLGKISVPGDLYPNDKVRAQKILKDKS